MRTVPQSGTGSVRGGRHPFRMAAEEVPEGESRRGDSHPLRRSGIFRADS
jgi:hypothetical protein